MIPIQDKTIEKIITILEMTTNILLRLEKRVEEIDNELSLINKDTYELN